MLGLLLIGASIWAAFRLAGTGLFAIAVINAIANVWGIGIMHNYKHDPFTPRIPALIAMLSSVGGILLLLASFAKSLE